ncbi:MAG: hypothetical protein F9K27_08085 [Anaerolineae bacterium]|nr:MAG: hypothetical protein F9K27_08085 [Anaerolineae bacterium]
MDGIFGVGPAEILIIVFVLMVIGGPRNTVKWAREAGKVIHQLRMMWSRMMNELEKELGDDGKEIMKTAQELTRGVNQLRSTANPRALASRTTRFIEELAAEPEKPQNGAKGAAPQTSAPSAADDETTKYAAWLPPEKKE